MTPGSRPAALITAAAEWVAHRGVSPTVLTLAGLSLNVVAAACFAAGVFRWGALVMLLAALGDLLDGAVARASAQASPFGAFLDSVVDRYSDLVLLTGLILYYARHSALGGVALTCVTLSGAVLTSYARARAEGLLIRCDQGLIERPERVLILAAGALVNRPGWAVAVLAVLTHLTVLQRIRITWRATRGRGPSLPTTPA